MIVDGHVHVFPPDTARHAAAIPMESVPHTADAFQRLDLDVEKVAGPRPLVPQDRDGRCRRQPLHAQPPQPRTHGRPRHAQRSGARRFGAVHWQQSTIPASVCDSCVDPLPCRECSTSDRPCRYPFSHKLLACHSRRHSRMSSITFARRSISQSLRIPDDQGLHSKSLSQFLANLSLITTVRAFAGDT